MSVPLAFGEMKVIEFISKIQPLFPSLRRHLGSAVSGLREDTDTCPDHWRTHSAFSGNPDIPNYTSFRPSASRSVIKETLQCFGKALNIPDVQRDRSVLSDLLEAFQPISISDCFFKGMQLIPSPGDMAYLYAGAYSFVGNIFDAACALSSFLSKKLGTFAYKLLMQKSYGVNDIEDGQKVKAEVIQKLLRIYLENSQSTSDSLSELACSVLPQLFHHADLQWRMSVVFLLSVLQHFAFGTGVKISTKRSILFSVHHLSQRFYVCLRRCLLKMILMLQHEENLAMINRLVKEILLLEKARGGAEVEEVKCLLKKLQQSVNVAVSLCKTHDKVNLRAIAVKFGGKFVDSFLKGAILIAP
ncbi:Fanconi anemia group D2 protein [Capsicum chacoense]